MSNEHTPPTGMFVILNGFPGVGKLTILEMAKALLPVQKTCLLDNHLLIDPAAALFPDRGEAHHSMRRQIRTPVFKALKQMAQHGHTILMTACLATANEKDAAFLQEHLDMVRGTNVPLFWVNVHCDMQVLEQRITDPKRRQGGKTKLTDVGAVKKLVGENTLIKPQTSDSSMTVTVLSLDASGSVEDSVANLAKSVGLSM